MVVRTCKKLDKWTLCLLIIFYSLAFPPLANTWSSLPLNQSFASTAHQSFSASSAPIHHQSTFASQITPTYQSEQFNQQSAMLNTIRNNNYGTAASAAAAVASDFHHMMTSDNQLTSNWPATPLVTSTSRATDTNPSTNPWTHHAAFVPMNPDGFPY